MLISTVFCSFLMFCSPFTMCCSIFLLQLFKEELTQVKEGMKHINDLAHQLAISDVHLSMENARALEHLNNRWKVLQVEFIVHFVSQWTIIYSTHSTLLQKVSNLPMCHPEEINCKQHYVSFFFSFDYFIWQSTIYNYFFFQLH